MYLSAPGQVCQQFREFFPCGCVQSDKRTFDNQYFRRCKQHFRDLESPQLTAGEQDDPLVEQRTYSEQVEQGVPFVTLTAGRSQHFRSQRRTVAV